MDRRDIIAKQITKYSIFVLSVFILYILQSTPGFLQIFGIKPVLIIPFCTSLAMLDETEQAGVVYLVGGLLCDLSAGRVVGGFSISLIIVCLAAVIAVKFIIKTTSRNFFYFAFGGMMFIYTIDFMFAFIMGGGYESLMPYYLKNVVGVSLYSALFTQIFYRFIDYINGRFMRFDAR